jgi:hypothetical protein
MLDVHPPHAPTHTWRDFLIHIATIVVGLIIAVGLEQTVELIHHAHQRRELREALRSTTEINDTWAKDDVERVDGRRRWALEQLTAIEKAGASGPLTLRRLPRMELYSPNTGVWLAARQNGQAALLTVSEQNFYADMDRVEDGIFVSSTSSIARYSNALTELESQLLQRTIALPSGDRDLSALTPAQRLKMDDQLRTLILSLRDLESRLLVYSTYTEYILTTPAGQLEESNSIEGYMKIFRRNRDSHPDLESVLQSQ